MHDVDDDDDEDCRTDFVLAEDFRQFCLVVATLETDPDGSRYCVAFTDLEEILLVDLFAYGTQRTIRTHEYHVYGWD